jgi:hypothetical protein
LRSCASTRRCTTVDAKDDVAKAFYMRFGFTALRDRALTLYLPLGG